MLGLLDRFRNARAEREASIVAADAARIERADEERRAREEEAADAQRRHEEAEAMAGAVRDAMVRLADLIVSADALVGREAARRILHPFADTSSIITRSDDGVMHVRSRETDPALVASDILTLWFTPRNPLRP